MSTAVVRYLALVVVLLTCGPSAIWAASPTGNLSGALSAPVRSHSRHALAWPPDPLDWRSSPVDLSFLNADEKPAGKHGFLRRTGDRLVFEDGTPARFWGTNVTADSLFATTHENVREQARRLSELGFNLVRLHHIDAIWVHPNVFGDQPDRDTQRLSANALKKLDWWIKCLEDEGIYVWLDLEDNRQFRKKDAIYAFDEISKGKMNADPKGYSYVNPSIERAMQRFNEALLTHRNAYSGTTYKDDPGIATVLITNENDLTNHFGNNLLPSRRVPWHSTQYMQLAGAFASIWGLPRDQTWKAWLPGPSKVFLNDLEYRFDFAMISHLRALGVQVPIVPTSTWGFNPLYSLPSLTAGDIIDVHAYGGAGELGKNPLREANFVDWLAAAQVAGRPMSVTEWNVAPFPVPDRNVVPLYVAASASHQGWGAVMQFAYSEAALNSPDDRPDNWHAFNDPGLIATLPAAALLYRRGDVREADTIYAFAPTARELFGRAISPATSVALRTAVERGRLVIALPKVRELPWLGQSSIPAGAKLITDPDESLIAPDARGAVSDTGELRRNWEQGTFTIDTPRTQAAMGRIGGKTFSLADVEIALETLTAAVSVQSMDKRPIAHSRSILISLGSRSELGIGNVLPFHSEPLAGRLTIGAPAGLKLYAESMVGKKPPSSMNMHREPEDEGHDVAAFYFQGRYHVILGPGLRTHWLILK